MAVGPGDEGHPFPEGGGIVFPCIPEPIWEVLVDEGLAHLIGDVRTSHCLLYSILLFTLQKNLVNFWADGSWQQERRF